MANIKVPPMVTSFYLFLMKLAKLRNEIMILKFSLLKGNGYLKKLTNFLQDHDCRGNIVCFMDHVSRLLEICAPTRDLWKKFGWTRLSVSDILKKIYYEGMLI